MATDVARLAMEFTTSGAKRVQSDMDALRAGSIRLTKATERQIAQSQRVTSTFRAQASSVKTLRKQNKQVNNSFRNVALQLNQVAQQGAITGNFFQALAIQLPDLVIGMGPLGIILGGIAGGLATLAFSANDASEETDTLRQRIDELKLSYRELTSAQKASLQLEFAAEERARQKQISETEDRLKSLRQTIEDFNRGATVRRGPTSVAEALISPEQADRAQENLVRLQGELDTLKDESRSARNALDELVFGFDDPAEAAREAQSDIKALNKSLRFQIDTLGDTERAIKLAEIAQLEKNGADAEAVAEARRLTNEYYNQVRARKVLMESTNISVRDDPLLQRTNAQDRAQNIIDGIRKEAEAVRLGLDQEFALRQAHKDRVIALDDALRLGVIGSAEERNRLEVESLRQRNEQIRQLEAQKYQIQTQTMTNTLSATDQFLGNLSEISQAGGKKSFDAYKALASAQAAIAATLSIVSVLGDPTVPAFLKIPLATSIGVFAGVQVAKIQAQEFEGSFLGGGFTGSGSRSGGLDGKGGFPAILHPNETVIDHARGQSIGGDISVIINNAPAGTSANVTRERDGTITIDMFQADMANGGPMSRSIQGTFAGLRRQGR